MKKVRVTNGEEFKGNVSKTFKSDFQVYEYMDGYYGITSSRNRHVTVYGGDSACTDHYNKSYIQEVFKNWDGILKWEGERYGYKIQAD